MKRIILISALLCSAATQADTGAEQAASTREVELKQQYVQRLTRLSHALTFENRVYSLERFSLDGQRIKAVGRFDGYLVTDTVALVEPDAKTLVGATITRRLDMLSPSGRTMEEEQAIWEKERAEEEKKRAAEKARCEAEKIAAEAEFDAAPAKPGEGQIVELDANGEPMLPLEDEQIFQGGLDNSFMGDSCATNVGHVVLANYGPEPQPIHAKVVVHEQGSESQYWIDADGARVFDLAFVSNADNTSHKGTLAANFIGVNPIWMDKVAITFDYTATGQPWTAMPSMTQRSLTATIDTAIITTRFEQLEPYQVFGKNFGDVGRISLDVALTNDVSRLKLVMPEVHIDSTEHLYKVTSYQLGPVDLDLQVSLAAATLGDGYAKVAIEHFNTHGHNESLKLRGLKLNLSNAGALTAEPKMSADISVADVLFKVGGDLLSASNVAFSTEAQANAPVPMIQSPRDWNALHMLGMAISADEVLVTGQAWSAAHMAVRLSLKNEESKPFSVGAQVKLHDWQNANVNMRVGKLDWNVDALLERAPMMRLASSDRLRDRPKSIFSAIKYLQYDIDIRHAYDREGQVGNEGSRLGSFVAKGHVDNRALYGIGSHDWHLQDYESIWGEAIGDWSMQFNVAPKASNVVATLSTSLSDAVVHHYPLLDYTVDATLENMSAEGWGEFSYFIPFIFDKDRWGDEPSGAKARLRQAQLKVFENSPKLTLKATVQVDGKNHQAVAIGQAQFDKMKQKHVVQFADNIEDYVTWLVRTQLPEKVVKAVLMDVFAYHEDMTWHTDANSMKKAVDEAWAERPEPVKVINEQVVIDWSSEKQ